MAKAVLTVDDRVFQKKLSKLIRNTKNKKPLLKTIGIQGQVNIEKHFKTESDSQGRAWKPLNPKTLKARKGKRSNEAGILKDTGRLRNIAFNINPKSVIVGTTINYGGPHQFGAPRKGIPQREWLYIDNEGKKKIEAAAEEFYFTKAKKAGFITRFIGEFL